jgi:ferredoxin
MATYLLIGRRSGTGPPACAFWLHSLAILAFPPLIARSKHLHLALGPVAIFFRSATTSPMRPLDLGPENFEKETPDLGLVDLGQLPWKDVVDLNACVECGRCTDACPAHRSGGTLSPKEVILQMQRGLERGGSTVVGTAGEVASGAAWVTEEDLVQCYACGACEEACPVGIEHLGRKILDLRHGLVNNERLADKRIPKTFAKMQKAPHNPWGLSADLHELRRRRCSDLADGAEVSLMGCGSADPTARGRPRHGQDPDASGVAWGPGAGDLLRPARRLGSSSSRSSRRSRLRATASRASSPVVRTAPSCWTSTTATWRITRGWASG